MAADNPFSSYPSSRNGSCHSQKCISSPQTTSPSYRLAYNDQEFMFREELRPVRLQLELMKPELLLQEHDIQATVVIFGGTRVPEEETAKTRLSAAEAALAQAPDSKQARHCVEVARRILAKSRYYEEARKLGWLLSTTSHKKTKHHLVVVTGGGPGIMEAANRGAADAGAKSIGLNIVLPHEQAPNPYITPELCFQFHYFSIRKMHFLMRAQALVAFPGGFGTMDELFEALTLIQTKKTAPFPILLFCEEFWRKVINFDFLVEEGLIAAADIDLFRFVDTAEEAAEIISEYFNRNNALPPEEKT